MEAGRRYASVAVPVPVRRLFTYRVVEELSSRIETGSRVRVPFAGRKLVGTVVEWPAPEPDADVEVKAIESVLADVRRLPSAILELTRFVADYYLCSWGEAIEAALPPRAPAAPVVRQVRRLPHADPGMLPAVAVARRRLLEALPADGAPVDWSRLSSSERRAVRAVERLGLVEVSRRPAADAVSPDRAGQTAPVEPGPRPTEAQRAVLDELAGLLDRREFSPCVLFGATGSGKTEVYFRAAQRVLGRGGGVLYLVPEIGLTPLLASKIARRFGDDVALLHSGLSRRERHAAWDRVRAGRSRLVVGTRSAVFAPVADLGLIVVDEEQDGSYKQQETPRYNARDLAVVRARSAGATLLLGSATPSMESFHHALSKRYRLLRLGGRVLDRPLPEVRRVDMRLEYAKHGKVTSLSEELVRRLRECVARGEQALVLRNRRGWAGAVVCPRCGDRITCRQCSVTMTWHRREARLRCHYCGRSEGRPTGCPTCANETLELLGAGSEQVEDLIRAAVPDAVVERMDRDTIRKRGAHASLLARFDSGAIDVLVGTQMIAKGHDFPRVTLVGVLSADQSLGLPDFRAGERVFQLLTQVAGRAGRGEREGTVVVQAFDPDHPLLQQAAVQDFEAFFEREIRYRRALRYPPLAGMVQLIVHDPLELQAREWAQTLARALRDEAGDKLRVGGPGPAPIERIKGRYRQQILARSAGRRRLIEAVERTLVAVEKRVPRRAIQVDVDPYSLL